MTQKRTLRVLLIDDDPVFNTISTIQFKKSGLDFEVSAYTDARQVLEELGRLLDTGSDGFPDVIMLDINMPLMDGWEFLEEFEKLPDGVLKKCRVCMLSTSVDVHDIERSQTYRSVYKYFVKPLTPEDLLILSSELS